ncbi:putative adipose-regulatory protein-domain-containing protein, partial [Jimgerdemannia flammicorona]
MSSTTTRQQPAVAQLQPPQPTADNQDDELQPLQIPPFLIPLLRLLDPLFQAVNRFLTSPRTQRFVIKTFFIVAAILTVFGAAFLAYASFYYTYVPEVKHEQPMWFQYRSKRVHLQPSPPSRSFHLTSHQPLHHYRSTEAIPTAHVDLTQHGRYNQVRTYYLLTHFIREAHTSPPIFISTQNLHKNPTLTVAPFPQPLRHEQSYLVSVELEVPTSQKNLDIGEWSLGGFLLYWGILRDRDSGAYNQSSPTHLCLLTPSQATSWCLFDSRAPQTKPSSSRAVRYVLPPTLSPRRFPTFIQKKRSHSKQTILKYQSPLTRVLYTLWRAIPLVLDISQESQRLRVTLIEGFYEIEVGLEGNGGAGSVYVVMIEVLMTLTFSLTITSIQFLRYQSNPITQAVVTLSDPRVQVYNAKLRLDADFRGIRYFMYYWPISSTVFFISIFLFWEFAFGVFAWRLFGRAWWAALGPVDSELPSMSAHLEGDGYDDEDTADDDLWQTRNGFETDSDVDSIPRPGQPSAGTEALASLTTAYRQQQLRHQQIQQQQQQQRQLALHRQFLQQQALLQQQQVVRGPQNPSAASIAASYSSISNPSTSRPATSTAATSVSAAPAAGRDIRRPTGPATSGAGSAARTVSITPSDDSIDSEFTENAASEYEEEEVDGEGYEDQEVPPTPSTVDNLTTTEEYTESESEGDRVVAGQSTARSGGGPTNVTRRA